MNLKRFTARTSREALALVRQTFGEDAVVMSTRPCAEGVEVLAMAPESVGQLEKVGAPTISASSSVPVNATPPKASKSSFAQRVAQSLQSGGQAMRRAATPAGRGGAADRVEPALPPTGSASSVEQDVEQMAMSTLSFQDYVRERMLKRRQAEMAAQDEGPETEPPPPRVSSLRARRDAATAAERPMPQPRFQPPSQPPAQTRPAAQARAAAPLAQAPVRAAATVAAAPAAPAAAPRSVPVLREEIRMAAPVAEPPPAIPTLADLGHRADPDEMLTELRSMRGLIEQRFGALAFMEKLQRQPRHAQLTQRLLEAGFSPQLIRRLADSLPADGDPMTWAASVLDRNLVTGETLPALEDLGGVYALIGSTGVGKTTSTAKLAAAFAARHGAANLGLITLDAYRVGAHEQLRAYGRILGVPVHTAHDRASLEDLLELLSAKKMVLIDTAGMAQRDARTRELLDMLSHASVKKLLVLNASAQGETFEDVVSAYDARQCAGVVLSKIDEAVKLGPALDVLIRHKLRIVAVANGQRVPEDWHRLSANALVQRALRSTSPPAWRYDVGDVNLVFAAVPHPGGVMPPPASLRPSGVMGLQ
ncbi:MAG: flagellar biosynthesis protein FlhF [Rubrivivax sp.]|nr:flagellar biosynthesis protein FlhF [Rubrivivax sp.]